MAATNSSLVFQVHVVLPVPIILSGPCSYALETPRRTPKDRGQMEELRNQSKHRTSVSFLFPTPSCEMGCSCEMMKFQRKVDVPSITGGGKVQINHLISPAFSPLS
ncbi:unnamed protein product [Pleuronectes platessa]|uniref:Uncharacterized protein n=1 Tax=Pleuronectes platessa TaxID=8262 RepID=A0A9N7TQC6_PLEPL|nr:unnamed protein product [Pleuronectes platessa]